MFKICKKEKAERINPGHCRVNLPVKKKSIIIHHYCPHTYNAGDHFVIHSIRKSIRERIPNAVFIPKPCAVNRGWGKPARLTGRNITFSSRYADAVIIGGSDQYNGWSLRIRKDEISLLEPPFYLIGLGISSKGLTHEPNIPKKEYLEDIIAANEHASMSSVRDNRTYDFLSAVGVKKHVITGCPATFLFNRKFELKKDGPVLLTFPFPVVRGSDNEKFREIIELTKQLIDFFKKKGLTPVISCHDDRDVPPAQELFPAEQIFFSNYARDYFPVYEDASLVIGTRLHATILASAMGKPFVNVNLDSRGLGFSETFEMQDWNINLEGNAVFNKIKNRVDAVLSGNLSAFEKFYNTKELLRAEYEVFMDKCSEDIIERADKK